jgi:hypothetical protein
MYDMNAGIICIEESRHEDIRCRLRWKLGQNLGLRCGLLLAVQECRARWMLIAVTSFIPFQLIIVLFLVFGEVVLDFRKLLKLVTALLPFG